jgi:hypothetical protein
MLNWYEDDYIGIKFSERPHVSMRYALPSMSASEIDNIKKYPFLNRKDLKVQLDDYFAEKTYTFTIPKGYKWDGATIPRMFWRLIGSKTDSAFLIPSLIHDVLCENHKYVDNDRYFADRVFDCLLKVSEVPAFNRWLMFHSVDNFQKFCKWGKQK